jgi:hypothetical protein
VMQAFNVGVVKSRDDHVSAVSPDAVCVLECTTVGLASENERPLALGVRKLAEFLSTNPHLVEEVTNSPAGVVFNFMATMELKQKSETAENNAYSLRSNALDQGTYATTDCKWTSIANN